MNFFDFQYKMVIVVRTDFRLSKGQLAIQVSRAAIEAVGNAKINHRNWLKTWYAEGQKKVVVQVKSKDELEELYRKATTDNLPKILLKNVDLKNLPLEAPIALAIGPAPNGKIDKITSKLKLL